MRSVLVSQWQIVSALIVAACLSLPIVSSTSDLLQFLVLSLEPLAVTVIGIRRGNRRLAATFSALGACIYVAILLLGVSQVLPALDPLHLLWLAAISPLLAGTAVTSIRNSMVLWRAQEQPIRRRIAPPVPYTRAAPLLESSDLY